MSTVSLKTQIERALQGKYEPKAKARSPKNMEVYTEGSVWGNRTQISRGGNMTKVMKSVYGLYLDLENEEKDNDACEVLSIFSSLVKVQLEKSDLVILSFVVSQDWSYAPIIPKTREQLDAPPLRGWGSPTHKITDLY